MVTLGPVHYVTHNSLFHILVCFDNSKFLLQKSSKELNFTIDAVAIVAEFVNKSPVKHKIELLGFFWVCSTFDQFVFCVLVISSGNDNNNPKIIIQKLYNLAVEMQL